MSERLPQLLINDMIEAIRKIRLYTDGMSFDQFSSDPKTMDAVTRNFEIIGEAANRLPTTFKEINPTIDWIRIRGFRNRIVHDYMGIDYRIIWSIIHNHLDELETKLQALQTNG